MTRQELMQFTSEKKEEFLKDLSNFLKPYTNKIVNRVIKNIDKIIENETICNLLKELRAREEIEAKQFKTDLYFRLRQFLEGDEKSMEYDIHNNCLTHSNSYRSVLYDLLIK